MLEKYTRSDHRVGEHIADASPRNAEKSRAAKPGNKTEDQEDHCEGKMSGSIKLYGRGKRSPRVARTNVGSKSDREAEDKK
jgi:hypothetical protein